MTDLRQRRRALLSAELRSELAARSERDALVASVRDDLTAMGYVAYTVVRRVERGREVPVVRRRVYEPASRPASAHSALVASIYGPEVDPASTERAMPVGSRHVRHRPTYARPTAKQIGAMSEAEKHAALIRAGHSAAAATRILNDRKK